VNQTLISDVLTEFSFSPPTGVTELETAAAQRISMRNQIAKLWGIFPKASTLAELLDEIRNAVAIKAAVELLTNEGLSAEQTRQRLVAQGLLK
jgi:hypothetical protein